ncbi:hypothetical protein Isop_0336 [Isosphaera pallida ATCC 43644]|uniref:Uncharacterized protein n=1 Tax=Isosphaera pallida (strain ATCC 43644 / DSM 9630 / IS1B) TaxID=575540 RepID=E8QXV2_ISOPI|nr:hypothetical protein Isop_0336 [Isosphaera pallida ATCC 43644]
MIGFLSYPPLQEGTIPFQMTKSVPIDRVPPSSNG